MLPLSRSALSPLTPVPTQHPAGDHRLGAPRSDVVDERANPKPLPLVLVIDDHDDSRAIARLVLELSGFRVAEAATGTEGLLIALKRRPAAILLDLILPGINGWKLARLLRSDPRTSSTAIIALTAFVGVEADSSSLMTSCDALLLKPVGPRTLLSVVTRLVGVPARPFAGLP
jgi:CheY-like chemotaxis protein